MSNLLAFEPVNEACVLSGDSGTKLMDERPDHSKLAEILARILSVTFPHVLGSHFDF